MSIKRIGDNRYGDVGAYDEEVARKIKEQKKRGDLQSIKVVRNPLQKDIKKL